MFVYLNKHLSHIKIKYIFIAFIVDDDDLHLIFYDDDCVNDKFQNIM